MIKSVGIIGEPCAGKTTLLRAVREYLGVGRISSHHGYYRYEDFPQARIRILGDYSSRHMHAGGDMFDALGNRVLNLMIADQFWLPAGWTLFWESITLADLFDKLAASKAVDLLVVHLSIHPETRAARYSTRERYYSPEWLVQWHSRAEDMCHNNSCIRLKNDTLEDADYNMQVLSQVLGFDYTPNFLPNKV